MAEPQAAEQEPPFRGLLAKTEGVIATAGVMLPIGDGGIATKGKQAAAS